MKYIVLFLSFIVSSVSLAGRVLPMIPVYKETTFSKKFMGVKIPYESFSDNGHSNAAQRKLGLGSDDLPLAHAQLRALGLYTYPALDGMISIEDGEPTRGVGGVLGTINRFTGLTYVKSTTIGLTFSFGKSDDNMLVVGEETTYGIKMDFVSAGRGDLRTQKGFWLTDPISTILKEGQSLVEGDTAMDIALKTARYGNFRLKAQNRDANSLDWPRAKFKMLGEGPRSQMAAQSRRTQGASVTNISRPLAKALDDARKNGSQEAPWRETLGTINNAAPTWQDPYSQRVVQDICDMISNAYGTPMSLNPNCSVFASLTPNAFAYPGGDVFVTAGLMGVLPNVDTLAFFLAHEYSHVLARHTTKKMKREDFMARFYTTMSILSTAVAWGRASDVAELARNMGVKEISLESVRLSTEALLTEHTRDDEDEADLLGLEMAMNIGADPGKIIDGLRAMQKYFSDTFVRQQNGAFKEFMTADHRVLDKRIQTLSEQAVRVRPSRHAYSERLKSYANDYEKFQKTMMPLMNFYHLEMRSRQ